MDNPKIPGKLTHLYTKKCIDYRWEFNKRMHNFLNTRIELTSQLEKTHLDFLVKELNLAVPFKQVLDKLNNPFDIISVSLLDGKYVYLFVEDHSAKQPYKEGIGKTAIFLELLGMEIPYDKIPNTTEKIVESGIREFSPKKGKRKLLSSDMCYIGNLDGSLGLGVVIGEQLVAQWDLARHICRVKDPKYVAGKHRSDPELRRYLKAVAEWYYLDPKAFADNTKPYSVTHIFIIKRTSNSKNMAVKRLHSTKVNLKKILENNPCYHHSTFWKINKEEHARRLKALIKNMNKDKIPKIYKINIPEKYPIKKAAKFISQKIKK